MRRCAVWLVAMGCLRWFGDALGGVGLVRDEGQAQQQHRMTPQHMEAMCARITAVVEDMAPVQHGAPAGVHEV